MFELISHIKPMHVMDLPQLPDEPEAVEHWKTMIYKVKVFLEKHFNTETTDEKIRKEIKNTNIEIKKMNEIFDFLALEHPVVGWEELYDILFLSQSCSGDEMFKLLDNVLLKLHHREKSGYIHGDKMQ